MTTMNISLPEEMKAFVEKQVASGDYGTASEYLRELIRRDQTRRVREEIDLKLLAALESESIPVTPEFWEKLRNDAEERIAKRARPT